jgi:hypothetical protein
VRGGEGESIMWHGAAEWDGSGRGRGGGERPSDCENPTCCLLIALEICCRGD